MTEIQTLLANWLARRADRDIAGRIRFRGRHDRRRQPLRLCHAPGLPLPVPRLRRGRVWQTFLSGPMVGLAVRLQALGANLPGRVAEGCDALAASDMMPAGVWL